MKNKSEIAVGKLRRSERTRETQCVLPLTIIIPACSLKAFASPVCVHSWHPPFQHVASDGFEHDETNSRGKMKTAKKNTGPFVIKYQN